MRGKLTQKQLSNLVDMKHDVDIRFRNYLINLYLKGYNGNNLESCLSNVDLSSRGQWYEISGEAKLNGIEDSKIIVEVANSIREELRKVSSQEKLLPIASIQIYDIQVGDHIMLKHGNYSESLLCIEQNSFMVIYHNRGYLQCGSVITSLSTIWRQNVELEFLVGIEKYQTEKIVSIHHVLPSDLNKYIDQNKKVKTRTIFGNHLCCGDGIFEMEGFSMEMQNDSVFVIELNESKGSYAIIEGFDLSKIPNIDRCIFAMNHPHIDYTLLKKGKLIKSNHTWKILSKCEIQYDV